MKTHSVVDSPVIGVVASSATINGQKEEWTATILDRAVELLRDTDGRIYSVVREEPAPNRFAPAVVVDRQAKWRGGEDYVRRRAVSLAKLLRVPFYEDLRWPCGAIQGSKDCQCPRCIGNLPTRDGPK